MELFLFYRWLNQLSIWKIQRATLWRSGYQCWDHVLKLQTGSRISCGTTSTQKAYMSTRYIYMDKYYSIFLQWFRSHWYGIPKFSIMYRHVLQFYQMTYLLSVNCGVGGKMHTSYPCWLMFRCAKNILCRFTNNTSMAFCLDFWKSEQLDIHLAEIALSWKCCIH